MNHKVIRQSDNVKEIILCSSCSYYGHESLEFALWPRGTFCCRKSCDTYMLSQPCTWVISQIDQSTSEWFRLREVLSSDSGSDKDYVVPKKLTKPAQPLKVTPILIILSFLVWTLNNKNIVRFILCPISVVQFYVCIM